MLFQNVPHHWILIEHFLSTRPCKWRTDEERSAQSLLSRPSLCRVALASLIDPHWGGPGFTRRSAPQVDILPPSPCSDVTFSKRPTLSTLFLNCCTSDPFTLHYFFILSIHASSKMPHNLLSLMNDYYLWTVSSAKNVNPTRQRFFLFGSRFQSLMYSKYLLVSDW